MKDILRREIITKRIQALPAYVQEQSSRIKQRLFTMKEYQHARTILFYVSYDKEVDTHDMIKESLSKGKHIIVPKADTKQKKLMLSELSRWEDLERCAYNILEPKPECMREVSIEEVDVIVVPGVVFDSFGNRIGHGMGYYDALLHHCLQKPKIGLAFEFQLVDRIPTEKHDVKVDKIVTEKRIIICATVGQDH